MTSPLEWEEDTMPEQRLRLDAYNAITGLETLIKGRKAMLERRRAAGLAVKSAYKSFASLQNEGANLSMFLEAWNEEDEQTGVRMWPIRKPERLLGMQLKWVLRPPSFRRRTTTTIPGSEISGDKAAMDELLEDLKFAIATDAEVIVELGHLRDEVFGLFELKVRFVSLLFSVLSGGGRISATARNSVLGGNPGTGKTTFAAIFSKLTVLLGWVVPVDPKNQTVRDLDHAIELTEELVRSSGETDPSKAKKATLAFDHGEVPKERARYMLAASRENFVAGFSGMTALRTMRTIRESLGGVLFIDEAYALATSPEDSYGLEALNTLVNWIPRIGTDRLGIFVLAGYVDKIRRDFFRRNEGLQSRFPHLWVLPDYTPIQLAAIFSTNLSVWKRDFGDLTNEDQNVVALTFREEALAITKTLNLRRTWESVDAIRPRKGEEMFFAQFFSAFSGVFKIGNIRKLQNYMGAIEQRWARARLMSAEPKTPEWFAKTKVDKVLTLPMMLEAMEEVLENMRDCDDESLACDSQSDFAAKGEDEKGITW